MNSVVNGSAMRHGLERALKVTNCDVVHLREIGVEVAQCLLVRMMDCVDDGLIDKARARESRSVVQVDDVAIASCVCHRPSCVIYVFQVPEDLAGQRPL